MYEIKVNLFVVENQFKDHCRFLRLFIIDCYTKFQSVLIYVLIAFYPFLLVKLRVHVWYGLFRLGLKLSCSDAVKEKVHRGYTYKNTDKLH